MNLTNKCNKAGERKISCRTISTFQLASIRERFEDTDIASYADMLPAQIRKYCVLDDACQALMKTAMRQLKLTARAYHRLLKLTRSIADLAGSEEITQVHLVEA